jgi:hypothetical protein
MGSFVPEVTGEPGDESTMWWTNGPTDHFVNRTSFEHDDESVKPQYRTMKAGEVAMVSKTHPVAQHPTQPEKAAVLDLHSNPTEQTPGSNAGTRIAALTNR